MKLISLLTSIKRNIYGIINFERARNRILYSQNKYETYSSIEHKDKIKRTGKPRESYNKTKK